MTRLKNYLKEKYLKGFNLKSFGIESYIEIFKNPSKRELTDISRELAGCRFFAVQKTKTVYAWVPRMIHHDAFKFIPNISKSDDQSQILGGIAQKKGGEFYMTDYSSESILKMGSYRRADWEWVNKYINVTRYIPK